MSPEFQPYPVPYGIPREPIDLKIMIEANDTGMFHTETIPSAFYITFIFPPMTDKALSGFCCVAPAGITTVDELYHSGKPIFKHIPFRDQIIGSCEPYFFPCFVGPFQKGHQIYFYGINPSQERMKTHFCCVIQPIVYVKDYPEQPK